MNKHEYFMEHAIKSAREGINKGQTPFGCCIVRNDEIIAVEHNLVWQESDITAHAEITTIRKACKITGSINLENSVIYSTCEPCPMCFSAIHWAGIKEIYYGASITDAKNAGFNELEISNEMLLKLSNNNIKISKDILKDKCVNLFMEWKQKVNNPY